MTGLLMAIVIVTAVGMPLSVGVSGMTETQTVHAQQGQRASPGTLNSTSSEPAGDAHASCGFIDDSWSWAMKPCLAIMGNMALGGLSSGVNIAGQLLTASVEYTVINMDRNVDAISGINKAWTVLRDLTNAIFIFILLYIAVMLILNADTAQTKKALGMLVLIALIVNFSLFITKAVIDVSNVIAVEFHDQATQNLEIGSRIFEQTRLTTIYEYEDQGSSQGYVAAGNVNAAGDPHYGWDEIFLITIVGSILMVVAMFVLLAAAVLFVVRFVVLVFLMILSPLAFAAFILPQTSDHGKKWFSRLISESFYAPAFMVLLFASMEIIDSFQSTLVSSDGFGKAISDPNATGVAAAASSGGATGPMGVFLNFFILIGFVMATLIAAKNIGGMGAAKAAAMGANKAKGAWKKTQGGAKKAGKRTAGAATRGTVGRAARKFEEKAERSSWGQRIPTLRKATKGLQSAKFGTKKSATERKKEERKRRKSLEDAKQRKPAEKRERIRKKAKRAERQEKEAQQELTQAQQEKERLLQQRTEQEQQEVKQLQEEVQSAEQQEQQKQQELREAIEDPNTHEEDEQRIREEYQQAQQAKQQKQNDLEEAQERYQQKRQEAQASPEINEVTRREEEARDRQRQARKEKTRIYEGAQQRANKIIQKQEKAAQGSILHGTWRPAKRERARRDLQQMRKHVGKTPAQYKAEKDKKAKKSETKSDVEKKLQKMNDEGELSSEVRDQIKRLADNGDLNIKLSSDEGGSSGGGEASGSASSGESSTEGSTSTSTSSST